MALSRRMRASYTVLEDSPTLVLIRDDDLGDRPSITNDAEAVVSDVFRRYGDKRIDYIDSMGGRDQLVHTNGVFTGFAPAAMY